MDLYSPVGSGQICGGIGAGGSVLGYLEGIWDHNRLSPGFLTGVPLGRLFDKLKTEPLSLNARATPYSEGFCRSVANTTANAVTNEMRTEGSLLERFSDKRLTPE